MQKRKFDELISHFNRKVSDMSIDQKYKMELLGMISAIVFAHEKELSTNLAEVGKDCISRQQAIDTLNKLSESTYVVNYGVVDCDDAINAIAALPSTEPKKGKWIKTARWGRVYYCNQCRNYLDFNGVNAGRGSTNFCPNCGADMREKGENSESN